MKYHQAISNENVGSFCSYFAGKIDIFSCSFMRRATVQEKEREINIYLHFYYQIRFVFNLNQVKMLHDTITIH